MGASVENMQTPPPRPASKDELDEQPSLLDLTYGSKDELDAQPIPRRNSSGQRTADEPNT